VPAKRPPRISLRQWIEQALEPGDLLERKRPEIPEMTLGPPWGRSIDPDPPDPPPDPSHERVRARTREWTEAWANDEFQVFASRGAADAKIVTHQSVI
jgi:hypothetical protein